MPAPSPSMTPSVGAKLGKSANALPNCSSSSPPARAISAEISVRAIAATEWNTSVSTNDRHSHADQLADRGGGLLGLVHHRAVPGDLDTGAIAERGRLLEPLARLLAERGRGVVVLDRHIGDARVRGEPAAVLGERARRARDMRLGAYLLDGPLDGGAPLGLAKGARLHGEDDVRRIARRRREALVEQVDRALRFRAGGLEVVDERAAGGGSRKAESDERHRHDRQ